MRPRWCGITTCAAAGGRTAKDIIAFAKSTAGSMKPPKPRGAKAGEDEEAASAKPANKKARGAPRR